MNKDIKRTIYLVLIAIILFSASMSVPVLYYSKWKEPLQGGAAGIFFAAIITIIPKMLLARKKSAK